VISIFADPNDTIKGDPTERDFLFRRTGPSENSIDVLYACGNGAQPGTDFSGLPTRDQTRATYHITIPGGNNTADVKLQIYAIENGRVQGTSYAVLALSFSDAYYVDPNANSAAIAILDDNVPPQVQPTSLFSAAAGQDTSGYIAVIAPNANWSNPYIDTPSEFTASIDWGDGSPIDSTSNGGLSITGNPDDAATFAILTDHTFDFEGVYNYSLAVTMSGSVTDVSGQAVVGGAGFTVTGTDTTLGYQDSAGVDTGLVTLAKVSDADGFDGASNFAATIDWGDGTSGSGTIDDNLNGQLSVTGEHVYANGDGTTHQAQVSIHNQDGLAASVLSTIAIVPAPTGPPPLRITGITFAGTGVNPLIKGTVGSYEPSSTNTPFSVPSFPVQDPDNKQIPNNDSKNPGVPIGPMAWTGTVDGAVAISDPVSYVAGSMVTMQVTAVVKAPLPAGTPVTLTGVAQGGAGIATTTSAPVEADGTANQVVTFQVSLTQALANTIQNTKLNYRWQVTVGNGGAPVDVGETSDPLFVTIGPAAGAGLAINDKGQLAASARRLDALTAMASGLSDPAAIVKEVASAWMDRTLYDNRNSIAENPQVWLANPYVILDKLAPDRSKEDCFSLATLAKQSLDALGVAPNLDEVYFVFARTKTWDQASAAETPDYVALPRSGLSSKSSEATSKKANGTPLVLWAGGYNTFEGCLVFNPGMPNQRWYMGGVATSVVRPINPKSSDYEVLMHWTLPNFIPKPFAIGARNIRHQSWFIPEFSNTNVSAVPYPIVPILTNMTQQAAKAALEHAGYYNYDFNSLTKPAPNPNLVGLVAGIPMNSPIWPQDLMFPNNPGRIMRWVDPNTTIPVIIYI